MRNKITIIVGATPQTQRLFHVDPTLLHKHAPKLFSIISSSTSEALELTIPSNIPPSAIRNFIDWLHSSIYALNKNAPDYHPLSSHAQSWILGNYLNAPKFRDYALLALHALLAEQIPGKGNTVAWKSTIHPTTVKWVCENTLQGEVLRVIFFDAIAARVTQSESINLWSHGLNMVHGWENEIWKQLFAEYIDFAERMESSQTVKDAVRVKMLRPVGEYLKGLTGMVEREVDLDPQRLRRISGEKKEGVGVKSRIGSIFKSSKRKSVNVNESAAAGEKGTQDLNEETESSTEMVMAMETAVMMTRSANGNGTWSGSTLVRGEDTMQDIVMDEKPGRSNSLMPRDECNKGQEKGGILTVPDYSEALGSVSNTTIEPRARSGTSSPSHTGEASSRGTTDESELRSFSPRYQDYSPRLPTYRSGSVSSARALGSPTRGLALSHAEIPAYMDDEDDYDDDEDWMDVDDPHPSSFCTQR